MNIPDHFCILPWLHLSLGIGGISPCCRMYNTFIPEALQGRGPVTVLNTQRFQELRSDILNGVKVSHCTECYRNEESGIVSQREIYNRVFNIEMVRVLKDRLISVNAADIKYIDLRNSNACNLSCRTCGPHFSTSWNNDACELGQINSPIVENQAIDLAPYSNCSFYYFAGGEPLLDRNHLVTLKSLQNSNTTLNYDTNLSINHKTIEKLLPVWSKFKEVNLSVSIDHIEKLKHEYIRNGIDHQLVLSNLKLLIQTEIVNPIVHLTLSLYNILDLHTIIDALLHRYNLRPEQLVINPLYAPEFFSIQLLSQTDKREVERNIRLLTKRILIDFKMSDSAVQLVSHLKGIVHHMNMSDRHSEIEKYHDFNHKIDKLRGQSFKKVFLRTNIK